MIFDCLAVEKIIGYTFINKELLKRCFTHSSYANEHKTSCDNERLEFLGDSVLGLVVTDFLYKQYKDLKEGNLTFIKQKIVSREPLSKCIFDLQLEKYILFGEGARCKQNLTSLKSSAENLFEAIVAGIYIDGGFDCASKFIYEKLINKHDFSDNLQNSYKNQLQEYIQKNKLGKISYILIEQSGLAHQPTFKMAVCLDNKTIGQGEGASKQKASEIAAKLGLEIIMGKDRL